MNTRIVSSKYKIKVLHYPKWLIYDKCISFHNHNVSPEYHCNGSLYTEILGVDTCMLLT